MFRTLAAFCIVSILAGQAPADEPQPVTAVRGENITIDGKLDEPAWTTGPWITTFRMTGTGEKPPVGTTSALRFDDRNLYYAVVCDEPDMDKLKADADQRDKGVWGDDCVELMLDVTGFRNEYAHIIVNARGTVFDSMRSEGGNRNDEAWDADIQVATQRGKDQWTVELAIPLADLGLGWHSNRRPWNMLAARARRTQGDQQLYTHIPNNGAFHEPKTFGPLELKEADLKPFIWEFPGMLEAQLTRTDKGKYEYRIRWYVKNLTGKHRVLNVRATLTGLGEKATAETTVTPKGDRTAFDLTLPVEETGKGVLELVLADTRKPDVPLVRRRMTVRLKYEPLRITVTRPFYRNNIYATQDIDRLEARGRLDIPAGNLAEPLPVKVKLVVKGANADPVVQSSLSASEETFAFSLDLPDLAEGDYELLTTVTLPDGRDVIDRQTLRKLPAVKTEWRIDRDLRLLRNGKPILPYGMFGYDGQHRRDVAAEGFTGVHVYHTANWPVERLFKYLDGALAEGMYVLVDPFPWDVYRRNTRKPLTDEEAEKLRKRVNAIKHHPAILGWYASDEPDLGKMSHERFLRIYEVLRETDPYHPVIQLPAYIYGIYDWVDTCDVLMPDPYPRFLEGSEPAKPLVMTTHYMTACRNASNGRKAWWIVPQAFDWADQYANSRPPTFVELRCQQLQAFIGGARGLMWFTDRHRENSVEMALGLPFLGREAKLLREALLAPEQPQSVAVDAPKPNHLHATLRKVGDHRFVLAVNTLPGEQKNVALTVQDLPAGELYVVSENRTVSVGEDGVIRDDFGKYGGHVYTTDPSFAFGQTLAAVQARIDMHKAKLVKPGNLAHRSTGATLELSSRGQWGASPKHLHDGYDGMAWYDSTPEPGVYWQVNLPEPADVGRVVLLGSNVEEYRIQVRVGDEWQTVHTGKHRPGTPLNVAFEPRKTQAVRFVFDKPAKGSRATEIELYSQ